MKKSELEQIVESVIHKVLIENELEIDYSNWGAYLPSKYEKSNAIFGSSSFRPTDSRTSVMYYKLPDEYIVASQNNYCIYGFQPQFGGLIKKGNRLFNRKGKDITELVRDDAKEYNNISDKLKQYIGL